MKLRNPCVLTAFFLLMSAFAMAQEASDPYESKLSSKFTLTQMASDHVSVAIAGTVLVLRKDNLVLWALVGKRLYTPYNTYADGLIVPSNSDALLARATQRGEAHVFNTGEKLWLTKVDHKGDRVTLHVITNPYGGIRYFGTLNFQFPKGTLPLPDRVLETVSEVFQPEGAPMEASDSPLRSDITSLAVGGVRLGMSAEEAITALKNYDSWPVLKKRYLDGHTQANPYVLRSIDGKKSNTEVFGTFGPSEDCKGINGQLLPRPPLLVAIVAAKANRIHDIPYPRTTSIRYTQEMLSALSDCDWTGRPVASKPDEDPEEVVVFLSPTPGHERVIAVSMWRSFVNQPTMEAVLSGARKRYPLDVSSTYTDQAGTYLSWRFDARDQLLPEARTHLVPTYRATSMEQTAWGPALPLEVTEIEGVGLDFYARHSTAGPDIATNYFISMFRGSDLFKFTTQLHAAQAVIDQQAKQKAIDKAKQNTVEIK